MTERLRELGEFKGVGHFEAIFWVEGLRIAPISTLSPENGHLFIFQIILSKINRFL